MSIVTWGFPTTVVFGAGSLSKLSDHVRRAGGTRALLVCDPGVVKAQIAERVQKVLEQAGIPTAVFDKVDPNPVLENVEKGAAAYKAHDANIVVSLGGGAPLDVGKLIALRTTHTRPLVGVKNPMRHRMSVLFPDPFGPRRASTSPRGTSNETSSTARIAP